MTNFTRQQAILLSAILGGKRGGFGGIENYRSSTSGELANHNLHTAVNFEQKKIEDAKALANVSDDVLNIVAKNTGISIETVKEAANTLAIAALKNLNDATRTPQSQAQIDSYESFGNGVRVHKDTGSIKIFALGHTKTVIEKGTPKPEPKGLLTKAKRAIEKELKLNLLRYRNFTILNAESIKINGSIITIL